MPKEHKKSSTSANKCKNENLWTPTNNFLRQDFLIIATIKAGNLPHYCKKTCMAEISQHSKLLIRASRYLVMYITLSIPSHLIIQEDIFVSYILSNYLSSEKCMLCVICQTNLPQQQFSNSIILFTTIFELTQDNKILITATKLFPYHSLYSSLLPWNFCRLFRGAVTAICIRQ